MNITLDYFNGDELAASTYLNKYALKDEEGKVLEESPEDMQFRIAKRFAEVEYRYNKQYLDKDIVNLSEYGKNRVEKYRNVSKETLENDVFKLFKGFKYIIPGGSVLYGLGNTKPISLSNCHVITPPEDNVESIINSVRDMAQIFKKRGGVGVDISKLRPSGAKVDNSAQTSTGAVSFMDLYSKCTEIIGQSGRRAALMLSIDVNHPDIFEFATIKKDLTRVTGANISIRLNDSFIEAVENNCDYLLKFPCDIDLEKELPLSTFNKQEYNKLVTLKGFSGNTVYVKRINAKDLWNIIIDNAWLSAEPGVLNDSKLTNYDPASVYPELKYKGLNPCAEEPLSDGDTCRLIHVNLYNLIDNPFEVYSEFNKDLAYSIFYECQVLGDNLVELEIEYIDRILHKINPKYNDTVIDLRWYNTQTEEFKLWYKIRQKAVGGRRTGCGITGLGDFYAALNLDYGNTIVTKELFKIKMQAELDATIDLSILRGSFGLYDVDKELEGNDWYNFIKNEYPESYKRMMKYGRRNVNFSTIAPTGSLSILTKTSSGIEPLFMPFYKRRRKCNSGEIPDFVDQNNVGFKEYLVLHDKLKVWFNTVKYKMLPVWLNREELYEEDLDENNQNWDFLYKQSPYYKQVASDIDYFKRVKIQSLIQRYITASISSTINLPEYISKDVVSSLYLEAFKSGCKGLTIYRDKSRSGILVASDDKTVSNSISVAKKRPLVLEADYYQVKVKGEQFIVLVGLLDNKPYEIFTFRPKNPVNIDSHKGTITKVGKKHYKFTSDYIVITDLQLANTDIEENAATLYSSMLLRHNVDIRYIVKIAKKVNENITSFSSAMCRILNKYIPKEEIKGESCPNCNSSLIRESGCVHCPSCGWSRCD